MSDASFELVDRKTGKRTELKAREGTMGPPVLDISSIPR